jgi:septum formation protein
MAATPLILASRSPYRRALLERLRLPFRCMAADVDESPRPGETPVELAERLAAQKALAVSARDPAALVIGSDQVASRDGVAFGKPGTTERAREQLRRSSGRIVHFHTAVALARGGELVDQCCEPFAVHFRELSDGEIARYVELEQPLDCAGSFRWEQLGIALFSALRGDDPTALEGLPLIRLTAMLAHQGLNPLACSPP